MIFSNAAAALHGTIKKRGVTVQLQRENNIAKQHQLKWLSFVFWNAKLLHTQMENRM